MTLTLDFDTYIEALVSLKAQASRLADFPEAHASIITAYNDLKAAYEASLTAQHQEPLT